MPEKTPTRRRIIVDGSNIATEGRSLPSLAQLDEAIQTFLEEYGGFSTADVTVVVDASFGHRIDPSERPAFEEAILHGEIVTPPAGAIGRGDGFILRIAEKSGALVLSNDSFQEFHAERPWLFDEGRLIGGKPVPGVGWVFTPRTPVRGPKSRSVTSQSRRDARAGAAADGAGELDDGAKPSGRKVGKGIKAAKEAKTSKSSTNAKATKAAKAAKSGEAPKAGKAAKAAKTTKVTESAKATKAAKAGKTAKAAKTTKAAKAAKSGATSKAGETAKATKATKAAKPAKIGTRGAGAQAKATKAGQSTNGRQPGPDQPGPALNDPMTFLTFVADHPIGSRFDGTVVSFTSHGAHVDVGDMRAHIPLAGLANPPPNKARDVLTKGETRQFELVSLDAARRRAALKLPGVKS
ncbi:MAG TPA: S1 RNA-binding domain-containing protein [Acidimicrobiales bacterium]|nr:S1 RNA-binding domain-containing protein [Acidimicrobiales bacterium]